MFIKPSIIKRTGRKNKNRRKILMRTFSDIELQSLAYKYRASKFSDKSIDKLFQEMAIAKNCKERFKELHLKYAITQE